MIKEKLQNIYDRIFAYWYWWDGFRNPFNWISYTKHNLKNLWLRHTRGVGCCDIFNYDSYLAKVIARDLGIYKTKNCSWPGDNEFKTFESWQDYIQEIISGLEAPEKIDWDAKNCFELETEAEKKQEEAMIKFAKRFNSFWI